MEPYRKPLFLCVGGGHETNNHILFHPEETAQRLSQPPGRHCHLADRGPLRRQLPARIARCGAAASLVRGETRTRLVKGSQHAVASLWFLRPTLSKPQARHAFSCLPDFCGKFGTPQIDMPQNTYDFSEGVSFGDSTPTLKLHAKNPAGAGFSVLNTLTAAARRLQGSKM